MDIVNEKIFQLGLKTGKEKLKVCGKKKDLVEIRCYLVFIGVKLSM